MTIDVGSDRHLAVGGVLGASALARSGGCGPTVVWLSTGHGGQYRWRHRPTERTCRGHRHDPSRAGHRRDRLRRRLDHQGPARRRRDRARRGARSRATSRLQHLVDMAGRSPGTLRFLRADLLEAAYVRADGGVPGGVAPASAADRRQGPEQELVDPAVLGTRTVLGPPTRPRRLTRSYFVASSSPLRRRRDIVEAPGGRLSEQVRTPASSLERTSRTATRDPRPARGVANRRRAGPWQLIAINRHW